MRSRIHKRIGQFADGSASPFCDEQVSGLIHGDANRRAQTRHDRCDEVARDGEFFDGTVAIVANNNVAAVVHGEVVGIAEARQRGDSVPIRDDDEREERNQADSQLLHRVVTNVRSINVPGRVHRDAPR